MVERRITNDILQEENHQQMSYFWSNKHTNKCHFWRKETPKQTAYMEIRENGKFLVTSPKRNA
jgi:hypothetical protein